MLYISVLQMKLTCKRALHVTIFLLQPSIRHTFWNSIEKIRVNPQRNPRESAFPDSALYPSGKTKRQMNG